MKIVLGLILAAATVALSAPSPDRLKSQEQKPVTENYNYPFFQNSMNNGLVGGSWPAFGSMASKQPAFPFPTDFGSFPKIAGNDGVVAKAGMSCTFENGKKKCTNHESQAKTRYS
uniref:KKK circle protein n=1 Tax=Ochlerotatus triseriatus TaxID=7162 RepID=C6ZQT1_OCHTR